MDPDPFYELAGRSLYLGLTLNARVVAQSRDYDHDAIDELFENDFKLCMHPVRLQQFKKMVFRICDLERRNWHFKREIRGQEDEEYDSDYSEGISTLSTDC